MIINTFYNNSHVPCLKASSSYSLLLLRKRITELGNLMCEGLQEVNEKNYKKYYYQYNNYYDNTVLFLS